MAKIHKISGSTQYLLNGVGSVNGKTLTILDEIIFLYSNYEKILADVEKNVSEELDERIIKLSDMESNLCIQLEEDQKKKECEIDDVICTLNKKANNSTNIFLKINYKLQYWVGIFLRNFLIKQISDNTTSKELKDIKSRKDEIFKKKHIMIKARSKGLTTSYNFLKDNETFFVGALGEEQVISTLSELPDDYHVINDVNLCFQRAIYWKKKNEYIKTCQIDHIVVGPSGIFLVETKNWKPCNIKLKSDDLEYQINRSALGLWYYFKDHYTKENWPNIRKVLVSINGYSHDLKLDKYIDIVVPHELCRYITTKKRLLSDEEVVNIVKLMP